jgi:hypothetical protein
MAVEQAIGESFHWFWGEDKVIPGQSFQADNETPEDLTNKIIQFDVWRTAARTGDPLLSLSSADGGITVLDQSTPDNLGKYEINVESATAYVNLVRGYFHYTVRDITDDAHTVLTYGPVFLQ